MLFGAFLRVEYQLLGLPTGGDHRPLVGLIPADVAREALKDGLIEPVWDKHSGRVKHFIRVKPVARLATYKIRPTCQQVVLKERLMAGTLPVYSPSPNIKSEIRLHDRAQA